MHSNVFQIGLKQDMQPVTEDVVLESRFVQADDATILHDKRHERIEILVNEILPKGMFAWDNENCLTYTGGMKEWREQYAQHIKDATAKLDGDNVFQLQFRIINAVLRDSHVNSLFIWDEDNYADYFTGFMETVSRLKEGTRLYIGTVMDYHF